MKLKYIGEKNGECDVDYGTTVAEGLRKLGVFLDSPCGGIGKCGKCRVVCAGGLIPADDEEIKALGDSIKKGYRLACKAVISGDVTVLENCNTYAVKEEISDIKIPEGVVCVDLGTTSVTAGCTVNGSAHFYTFKNPQSVYGADVISRISASEKYLEEMRYIIKKSLADNVPNYEQSKKIISANTVMQLIYSGQSPISLGRCPYESPDLFGYTSGSESYMPCVGGFVGGDVVSGLFYAIQTEKIKEKTALYIDIGTNGEVVLMHDGEVLSCATAAGPCFEGAGVQCGMQASDGAVYDVRSENGKTVYSVIGGGKPTGICGSGIVSLISHLLETDMLSHSGYLSEETYYICDGVYITRKDIRMIQGAKAAIGAGISVLCKRAEISVKDIEKVYVAGAFGEHLDINSAKNIGLLPDVTCETLGNCSLHGACLAAQNDENFDIICNFAKKIKYIELSDAPEFTDEYINASLFLR